MIGLVLYALTPLHGRAVRVGFWVLAVVCVLSACAQTLIALPSLLTFAVGASFWRRFSHVLAARTVHLGTKVGAGLMALSVAAMVVPFHERHLAEVVRKVGDKGQPIGKAWSAIENLPKGARIAWFGPTSYWYYPLYGRRYRLVLRPVTRNGAPLRHLHERWRDNSEKIIASAGDKGVGFDNLLDNLIRSGVDYVFVTKWRGEKWPPQQAVLAASDRADAVYDDGYSSIWHVKR
jgi:hypothetical protein